MKRQNGLYILPIVSNNLEPKGSSATSCNAAKLYLVERKLQSAVKHETIRDLVRVLGSGKRKSWSVLQYLADRQAKEQVAQFCTDLELSWFTVLRASEGNPDPWNFSFWMFFGKTYPKALKAWAERDEINRKALERCAEMVRRERERNEETKDGRCTDGYDGASSASKALHGDGAQLRESDRRNSHRNADNNRLHVYEVRSDDHASSGLYESAKAVIRKPVQKVAA